ncbi:hypothetical protein [Streptomyces europaeiscabiei]|uniref:hypothetical protein n=1 Tax=Streptomyces europaeiscabiei TaxID=146819 RepID=UPI002E263F6B|nr:hypothetical protein OG858_21690 [Streptomyces europaeiscabiei]
MDSASNKRPARAWYFFSEDIPDDELVVPILTKNGTAMAVRPGEMTPRLLKALNESVAHLINVGLWQPGDDGPEPPRKE